MWRAPDKRYEHADIVHARIRGEWDALSEASLGRIYQHVVDSTRDGGTSSFGMLSAYRFERSESENRAKQAELLNTLRATKLGIIKVRGFWSECKERDYSKPPDPETGAYPPMPTETCPELKDRILGEEPSVFVPNITKDQLLKLGKRYGQTSVLYSGEDTDWKVVFLEPSTGMVQTSFREFHVNKLAQYWSQLRGGRKFNFEERQPGCVREFLAFDLPAQSMADAMIEGKIEASYRSVREETGELRAVLNRPER